MADTATMTVNATIMPDEIAKTLLNLTYSYSPANSSEGWYYKIVDVTNASTDLIATETFLQKGGDAAGVDAGSAMPAITTSDVVKFLFVKHTGMQDDGSTINTADSIYLSTTTGTAAHNLKGCIEIGPSECWYAKLAATTVADIHVISGAKLGAGTSSTKVQCLVAAIIDDVA
mgnify:CR=1 FL=1